MKRSNALSIGSIIYSAIFMTLFIMAMFKSSYNLLILSGLAFIFMASCLTIACKYYDYETGEEINITYFDNIYSIILLLPGSVVVFAFTFIKLIFSKGGDYPYE